MKNKQLKKILLIMKLSTFFLFFSLISISAETFSQKFSFEIKGESIKDILTKIEESSDYKFLYRSDAIDVNKQITININDENIESILTRIFDQGDVIYKIFDDNLIVISKKTAGQQQSVTGRVSDGSTGEPIVGVNVSIEGTTTGAITDINGNFILQRPAKGATVSFSFIGYITQKVIYGDENVIDIKLSSEVLSLQEVVVIGYGTQKKATLTGSIVNVSGDEIVKSPMANVTSSLSGKLPGLIVNQRNGEPGRDDPDILIRGTGTFVSDPTQLLVANAPLIIIDGVERGELGKLNPDDIESISVLKDASAAIYGARAANGVIIVTTKNGKLGKPAFSFSYNTAFQHPTIVPKVLDAVAFAQAFNEGDWYRQGRPTTYLPFYTADVIQKFRDGSDPILYPNTDWMKVALKPYSLQQRASLQVTGGTEAVKYLVSFASLSQNSDFRHMPTDYKQYNLRLKVDVNVSKNLTIGANLNAILNDRQYTYVSNTTNFYNILRANPTLVAVYPNGLLGGGRLGQSPLLLDQRGYDKTNDTPLFSTFTATYKIPFIKGLKVDASFNYDVRNQFEKVFTLPYYFYQYNVNTQNYDKTQATGAATVELTDTYSKWTTMLYNYRITYENTFDNHHISVMVGQEQQKETYSYAMAYRKNFVSSAIDQINVGSSAPADKNNGGSASASAYNNYFGRLNYDFKSKYLAEFLFRYDGSQIFPSGKRYGFFPGFSLGWRMSEEGFIKDNLPYVEQLKLRFSHGQIGNDRVGAYQYLQSYSFGNNYVFGGNDSPGIYANTMPNPNITWEVSKKTDIGLETSLWKGLLGMELTLWKEKRSNILAQRNLSIPAILGFSALPSENIGKVDNHGFEIVLSHRNTINKLVYSIEANTSFARSKIVYMDETPQAEPYQNMTGLPVGASLYYKADGIFHTQDELNNYPHVNGTQVGDIKVLDLNGDGVIDSKDQFRFDKTNIPEVVFGLNLGLQYQNFDLSVFFQGQTSVYNYDGDFLALGTSAFDNALVARAKNHWTVDNPNGTMPRADSFQPGNTTFFLYDATFVRLKTFEFGYSLPKNLTSKIALENVRFYVSGSNLLTWAKTIKWCDPELNGSNLYYPQQRIINLGINVKF